MSAGTAGAARLLACPPPRRCAPGAGAHLVQPEIPGETIDLPPGHAARVFPPPTITGFIGQEFSVDSMRWPVSGTAVYGKPPASQPAQALLDALNATTTEPEWPIRRRCHRPEGGTQPIRHPRRKETAMTQQDHPTLSAPGPQLPAPGGGPAAPAGRSPSRTVRPWIPVMLCVLAFAAVYLVAVWTPFGQRAENGLMNGNGAEPAWFYAWSGTAYGSSAMPPLDETATPTLVVGLAVIVVVALVRRCWWRGCAAIGVVLVTFGGTEVLSKSVLPRPDLVHAPAMLTAVSFPSGHVAVPAGLALGSALVASPRVRPYVTAVGMLWLAVTAGAVQAIYNHRPSDVLGSTLLACACYGVAARLLPSDAAPGGPRSPRALPAVALALSAAGALALSAAGALAAGARNDSVVAPLVFAAAAFGCAALVWYSAGRAGAYPGAA